jgi:hypothetical protein
MSGSETPSAISKDENLPTCSPQSIEDPLPAARNGNICNFVGGLSLV